MKAGRNDPCPCGSGKKFKKCCLTKGTPASGRVDSATSVQPESSGQPSNRSQLFAPLANAIPKSPPPPPDPVQEAWEARWKEFDSTDWEGRRAIFLRILDDPELISDDVAFDMLNRLHQDAVQRGERARFAELVDALANRRPEVYQEGAPFYLSWRLQDAVVENSPDVLPLARELAARAGQDIDMVNRALRALEYHGRLATILEALRIGWPLVRESSDIVEWGIGEFAQMGVNYEIYNCLEQTPSPKVVDQELLNRVKFFTEDPDMERLVELFGDIAGNADTSWTLNDFTLEPVRKNQRYEWDDDDEKDRVDPGAQNLLRLIFQFVGHLRREEGIPYPKGELIRDQFLTYFIRRHEGDLNPKLSMLDQAMNPKKKPPPPPRPSHPLCPERVTFEAHLAGLLGFMNIQYHLAVASIELVPAWLRFLESRGLIDSSQHSKTLKDLQPLQTSMSRLMETYHDDPALLHALQKWPAQNEKSTVTEASQT